MHTLDIVYSRGCGVVNLQKHPLGQARAVDQVAMRADLRQLDAKVTELLKARVAWEGVLRTRRGVLPCGPRT